MICDLTRSVMGLEKNDWGGGGNVKNMKGKIQTKVNDKGSQV
jgi:hypothetical protein